jgi:hypothetical protein
MPLNTAVKPLELSSYEDIKENFVIFYASRDESGNMWCPVSALLIQANRHNPLPCTLSVHGPSSFFKFSIRIRSFAHRMCLSAGIAATRIALTWKTSSSLRSDQLMARPD